MFKLISALPKVNRILRYLPQANDKIRPMYSTNNLGIQYLTEHARSVCVEQHCVGKETGKARPDKLFARINISQQVILARGLKFHFCSRQAMS